jgi:hypothetical protein
LKVWRCPNFLRHARKPEDIRPEIYVVDSKLLPYDRYMNLAVCRLPPETFSKKVKPSSRFREANQFLVRLLRD